MISNILFYQMSLRSELRVAMSATISNKNDVVRLYLQLELCLICGGMPIVVSNTHCVVVFCFICLSLRPVCTILPVYLNGPFLIVPLVFSNVYFMLYVL